LGIVIALVGVTNQLITLLAGNLSRFQRITGFNIGHQAGKNGYVCFGRDNKLFAVSLGHIPFQVSNLVGQIPSERT
jgi:hypothetical protein